MREEEKYRLRSLLLEEGLRTLRIENDKLREDLEFSLRSQNVFTHHFLTLAPALSVAMKNEVLKWEVVTNVNICEGKK